MQLVLPFDIQEAGYSTTYASPQKPDTIVLKLKSNRLNSCKSKIESLLTHGKETTFKQTFELWK
jgi:hypothetical protein